LFVYAPRVVASSNPGLELANAFGVICAPSLQGSKWLCTKSHFWGYSYARSAPEEHHVHSLNKTNTCALQRSAMSFGRPGYIPLLTERDRSGILGYKHVAPLEQEPSIPMMTTFRAKPLQGSKWLCTKSHFECVVAATPPDVRRGCASPQWFSLASHLGRRSRS
jgi:hypothetical protein